MDSGPTDDTSPTLRDVRVDIEGELGASFDIDTREERYILAAPTTALFTVFARDNDTEAENLTVEVVDESGTPVVTEPPEFNAGLWRLRTDVDRNMALSIRVRDAGGNEVVSEGALVLPSAADSMAGGWELRFFDAAQVVNATWSGVWTPTTWEELRGSAHVGGTFEMVGDDLSRAERVRAGESPEDADDATVESERRALFHLDDVFFSDRPFVRTGGTTELEGTWERTEQLLLPRSGSLEVAEDLTITLELNADGSWTETRTGTSTDATGTSTPINETRSGTYSTRLASSYTAGAAFFLSRTTTSLNGAATATEPDTFELFVIRLNRLLIQPWERTFFARD